MDYIKGIELMDFFNNVLVHGEEKLGSSSDKLVGDIYCRYLFKKVALALHKLHTKGVAHRDFKPENIMLVPEYLSDKTELLNSTWGALKSSIMRQGYKPN